MNLTLEYIKYLIFYNAKDNIETKQTDNNIKNINK